MRQLPLCAAVASMLASAPLFAEAAETFAIDQSCIAGGCFPGDDPGYPVTLSHPGQYQLTSDLEPSGNRAVSTIEIIAARVDLDLGGFTIDGGGRRAYGTSGVQVAARARSGVLLVSAPSPQPRLVAHIHGGAIRGFAEAGVAAPDVGWGTVFEDLVVSDNLVGIDANAIEANWGASVLVQSCELNRNALGIESGATNLTARSNSFDGNGIGINAYWGDMVVDNVFVELPGVLDGMLGMHCEGCGFLNNEFQLGPLVNRPYYSIGGLDLGGNTCADEIGGRCP